MYGFRIGKIFPGKDTFDVLYPALENLILIGQNLVDSFKAYEELLIFFVYLKVFYVNIFFLVLLTIC